MFSTAGAAHQSHAVFRDAAQDLGSVDLADDDVSSTHAGRCICHSPTVAMKLRQGVQVHIAIVHPEMPTERGRVDPEIAMGQLHPLRTGSGATGVVDRRRGVLVGLPDLRLGFESHQFVVRYGADDQRALTAHTCERLGEVGVDEQDPSAGVVDDVLDLFGDETEVDRHQDPTRSADPVEGCQQSCRVVADHGHPLAGSDPGCVQPCGDCTRSAAHLAIGHRTPTRRWLIRLVDHTDPVRVDLLRTPKKIVDCQCNLHRRPPRLSTLRMHDTSHGADLGNTRQRPDPDGCSGTGGLDPVRRVNHDADMTDDCRVR
jgi:hypothetical protein